MLPKRSISKSKPSKVWSYFVKSENGGKCKLCQKFVKSSGNTTNLTNHLKRNHKKIYLNEKQLEIGKETAGPSNVNLFNLEAKASTSKAKFPKTDSESKYSDINTDERMDSGSEYSHRSPTPTAAKNSDVNVVICTSTDSQSQSFVSQKGRKRQQRIDQSFSDISSFSEGGNKANKVTNAIIFMIAKDNCPLNITEKVGFQYLMRTVAPSYHIPGRKTISNLMDEKYEVLFKLMKDKISSIKHFCFTSDVWTDTLNSRSFVGVTVHMVCENKLLNLTIALEELSKHHTGEYLADKLSNIFRHWEIPLEKFVAAVTDNGSNIVKAISILLGKSKHLPCFAHTLNLVAQKVCEDDAIHEIIKAVKQIITFFKHSVAASDELRKRNDLKLIQSVPTRWNSTYYMLEKFVKISEDVGTVLLKFPDAPRMLTAGELQIINEIISNLKPIEQVSKEISGDSYVTASIVIPLQNCMIKQISNLSPATDIGKHLKQIILSEITKRFGEIEGVSLLTIATLLDLRFKTIHFNSPLKLSHSVMKLKRLIEESQNEIINEETIEEPTKNENTGSIWDYHMQLSSHDKRTRRENGKENNAGINELDHYFSQPLVDRKVNPIQFWFEHKLAYPVLFEIAAQYFPIVATSVPTERLFSRAGNIMDPSRNRLSSTKFGRLLFLNSLELIGIYNIQIK
ncbi:hypothetical protein NQ314_018887 [Rhamnusium bicolor]|uniref:BED-type domain-containing protein n=1 Tax=Rhamnusium bicolor TaxID=1586634 RepID=A0AAV8WQ21_9CUCU|nr:hypothetical protein NQ314_018887 [Rhamnusium bicolor]